MESTDVMLLIGGEIEKAFEQVGEDETRVAYLLSLLRLEPIEQRLMRHYKVRVGDGRLKFHPMAVVKSMLLKELKRISSYQQLITYLYANPEEGRLLGHGRFLPSGQTFSLMKSEHIDSEIRQLMDYVVQKIRTIAKENGRRLDIDFVPVGNRRGKSKRTMQRHTSSEGGRVVRYMKNAILPQLRLPPDGNHKYKNEDLVNALGYMAERQICANQGCNLMRHDNRFNGKAPHGRTLLGRLAKMDAQETRAAALRLFDIVFDLAKRRGLVPNHPVTLALDYTEIPYYGDDNRLMVVEGKPDKGTYHKHRYAVLKISETWGDLFLMALPIGVLTDDREAVRELIKFAMDRLKISHIVADKGFFSSKYISLFNEMGIKYLMPGVKNKRIMRLMQSGVAAARITIRSANREYVAKVDLAFKKDKEGDGDTVCFATNMENLMLYCGDLFDMYSRRWNIETGFRVVKHEFMARTTSTNYTLRMFLFMFSMLLYNVWVIVNAALNRILYGRQEGLRVMTAKLFMVKFYEACAGWEPPPDGI